MLLVLKFVLGEFYYPISSKKRGNGSQVFTWTRSGSSFDPGVGDDLEGVPLGVLHVEVGDHVGVVGYLRRLDPLRLQVLFSPFEIVHVQRQHPPVRMVLVGLPRGVQAEPGGAPRELELAPAHLRGHVEGDLEAEDFLVEPLRPLQVLRH